MLAHLKTLETRQSPNDRRGWKLRIARGQHECGFAPEDVQQLMKLVDWLMELPERLQRDYKQEIDDYEEGLRMPFMTIWERDGMKQGMLEMIEQFLRTRFGDEGAALLPAVQALDDIDKYRAIHGAIIQADSLDDVRRACAKAAAPSPQRKKRGNGQRGAR